MTIKNKFSSVEELDKLFEIINKTRDLSKPSDSFAFYKELKAYIDEIYIAGYNDGAAIKQQINENLN